jgi:hypothetical protein
MLPAAAPAILRLLRGYPRVRIALRYSIRSIEAGTRLWRCHWTSRPARQQAVAPTAENPQSLPAYRFVAVEQK